MHCAKTRTGCVRSLIVARLESLVVNDGVVAVHVLMGGLKLSALRFSIESKSQSLGHVPARPTRSCPLHTDF